MTSLLYIQPMAFWFLLIQKFAHFSERITQCVIQTIVVIHLRSTPFSYHIRYKEGEVRLNGCSGQRNQNLMCAGIWFWQARMEFEGNASTTFESLSVLPLFVTRLLLLGITLSLWQGCYVTVFSQDSLFSRLVVLFRTPDLYEVVSWEDGRHKGRNESPSKCLRTPPLFDG